MKKLLLLSECVVPENIHPPPPTEGHWKFRGGGSSKAVEGSWEAPFPEGEETRGNWKQRTIDPKHEVILL